MKGTKMTTTVEAPSETIKHELNALTSCDRHPSARAYLVAYKGESKLFWCRHCSNKYKEALFIAGWDIDDQTSILDEEVAAYNNAGKDSDF